MCIVHKHKKYLWHFGPVYPSLHWQLNSPRKLTLQVRAKFFSSEGHWHALQGTPRAGSP